MQYERNLEDLTFNSKPLIDDLTRYAEQLEPQGSKVVEIIQRRVMQVARRIKLSVMCFSSSVTRLLLNHMSISFVSFVFVHFNKNFHYNHVIMHDSTCNDFPPCIGSP